MCGCVTLLKYTSARLESNGFRRCGAVGYMRDWGAVHILGGGLLASGLFCVGLSCDMMEQWDQLDQIGSLTSER